LSIHAIAVDVAIFVTCATSTICHGASVVSVHRVQGAKPSAAGRETGHERCQVDAVLVVWQASIEVCAALPVVAPPAALL